jgi:hypothetical protein
VGTQKGFKQKSDQCGFAFWRGNPTAGQGHAGPWRCRGPRGKGRRVKPENVGAMRGSTEGRASDIDHRTDVCVCVCVCVYASGVTGAWEFIFPSTSAY